MVESCNLNQLDKLIRYTAPYLYRYSVGFSKIKNRVHKIDREAQANLTVNIYKRGATLKRSMKVCEAGMLFFLTR